MSQVAVPQRTGVSRIPPLALILGGVVVGLGIAAIVASSVRSTPNVATESTSHVQAIEGASSADLRLHFAAGNLTLGSLEAADTALSRMRFEGPSDLRPNVSYAAREGVGQLEYVTRDPTLGWQNLPFIGRVRDDGNLVIQFSPNIPVTLNVDAGASNTDLDLTHLRVTRLDLQTGASDTRIRLPESAGSTSVDIAAGVAGLHIEVPQGVAADIDVRNAVGNASIDQARFRSVGNGRYRSADYDTTTNRVQLRVELGIGELTVR